MLFGRLLKHLRNLSTFQQSIRPIKTGVLCDIDGVLLRGRKLIPGARESIKILYENSIPVIFLTNQGLQLEQEKAASLSKILDIKVKPEQVVLSHSPMRLYKKLCDKFVLVLGQQNIHITAKSLTLGFKNICEIEDIRTAYPLLDMVDKKRRYEKLHSLQHESNIANIEGIILLGEPVRWETALQLCIDILVSNGSPNKRPNHFSKKHIPVLACNTDLLWMAEASLPRFGHGAFLLCLESLYEKITGHTLQYSTITGKPFLITFQYADQVIQKYLQKKPESCLKRLYVIGDNPDTDIYGGNLYKDHIKQSNHSSVEDVISILVATGVHPAEESAIESPDHVHRDIVFDPNLRTPDYSVQNITEAVRVIIKHETTDINYQKMQDSPLDK